MGIFSILRKERESNVLAVCTSLLNKFGIRYTKYTLENLLQDHINYPSLLSVKDTLSEYGVESVAMKKGNYDYSDFETPFLCSIQKEDWAYTYLTVVTEVQGEHIWYLDPMTNAAVRNTIDEFELIDKNIVLLIDDTAKHDEKNYSVNRKIERNRANVGNSIIVLFLALFLISAVHLVLNADSVQLWFGLSFLVTSFIGLIISVLITWYEIDAYNPFIKEVCGGTGKKINCDAVLNAKQSSFLGISWGIWGLSFMLVLFLIQVFYAGKDACLFITSLASVMIFPYLFFSIYYQAWVVKQWCPLCLAMQAIILINGIIAFAVFNTSRNLVLYIDIFSILNIVVSGLLCLILFHILIPLLKVARDSKNVEKKWKRLHYNPSIFRMFLNQTNAIQSPTTGLGILLGNSDAGVEIIKVCNPYCGACAKVHPEIEEILEHNPGVKLRIIFTASGEDHDLANHPVAHFLAIQSKFGNKMVQEALNDWYSSPTKDYDAFAEKYPMRDELKQQHDHIIAMAEWCRNMKIMVTPTLFINGSELPDDYVIADLKKLLQ